MLALFTRRRSFAAALQHATTAADDNPDAAARTLRQALTLAHHEPATTPSDADLISAVVLYENCILEGDADDITFLLPWTRYAVAASHVLYGPEHPRTVEAIHAQISILKMACAHRAWPPHLTRELIRALTLLIDTNTLRYGPDDPVTLTYRTHRAIARHRLGHCRRAITELIRIGTQRLLHRHGADDAVILFITAAVLRACHAGHRAHTWLPKHLDLLPIDAVDDADQLYRHSDFASPIDVPGHRRVCTHPPMRTGPASRRRARHGGRLLTATKKQQTDTARTRARR